MAENPRLLFIVNDAAFFVSHRLPLAVGARQAGYDVHIATPAGKEVSAMTAHGLTHHPLRLSRSSISPLSEMATLLQIVGLLRRLRPRLVHLVTVKPVLYGGLAARLTGVPAVVAAISGLGDAFVADGWRMRIMRPLVSAAYRLALAHGCLKVIFQNPSDRDTLSRVVGLRTDQVEMVRGSGVDLATYAYEPEPEGVPVVTFASRLLRSKGVYEFVEAARLLTGAGVNACFQLVGDTDAGNRSAVPGEQIERWRREGIVRVLGQRADVARIFASSNLVVLPSFYGEGLPKVLLEAAACGRAVVTTDLPGCRDAVSPDTALLVPPRNASALARAIRLLLDDPRRRHAMGVSARALAERDFALAQVVARHLEIYQSLMTASEPLRTAPQR
ncbi:MAG TPA: glycosyltransferase family 4 protein [Steroidobacteraceae bacterium]|nr:glycosyltransferase family 4 protein [Steroidobacteraceae bacterium]